MHVIKAIESSESFILMDKKADDKRTFCSIGFLLEHIPSSKHTLEYIKYRGFFLSSSSNLSRSLTFALSCRPKARFREGSGREFTSALVVIYTRRMGIGTGRGGSCGGKAKRAQSTSYGRRFVLTRHLKRTR